MSPIGRIFSILNLVLAVWFLAWAVQTASKNDDFRGQHQDEVSAHTRTRTEAEDAQRRLRSELQVAEQNAATLRDQLEQERNRATRLEGELAAARNDANTQRDTAQRLSESYDALSGLLDRVNQEKDRAFEARVAAERARDTAAQNEQKAQSALADAQTQIRQLRQSIDDGEMNAAQLSRKIGDLQSDLDTVVAQTGVSLSAFTSQPQIDARVMAINYGIQPGLVALNVGASNGVQRGFTFEIYSGNQYKGQVRIENVHENMSTGLIVRPVDGVQIREGDRASTRL